MENIVEVNKNKNFSFLLKFREIIISIIGDALKSQVPLDRKKWKLNLENPVLNYLRCIFLINNAIDTDTFL